MTSRWITLCSIDELREGEGKYVELQGFRLAVFLNQQTPYVTDNACPHAGGSMSGGHVDANGCAVCPWHGWAFELKTGKISGGWDNEMLKTYPCRTLVDDGRGKVWVQAELVIA